LSIKRKVADAHVLPHALAQFCHRNLLSFRLDEANLRFSKEVYQREMKEYPGLNDQTSISIPRSGLVQK
ncbi:MAG: hypothetical protein ACTSR2_14750, partial [Candidatus Hodarchaeales archaeon]